MPLYMNIENEEVYAEECDQLLVRITRGVNMVEGMLLPYLINGESVWCRAYKFDDEYSGLYADLNLVSDLNKKMMATCGAALSGNLRNGLTENDGHDFYESLPEAKISGGIDIERFTEYIKGLDVTKITQDHHLFITEKELKIALQKTDAEGVDYVIECADHMARIGITNKVLYITIILYICVSGDLCRRMMLWLLASASNATDLNVHMKLESQAAKQLQRAQRDDLSEIFEMQVLWNRAFADVDWEKEVSNRVDVKVVDILPSQVYNLSRNIFMEARLNGARPRNKTWEDYWSIRWLSMPNGSVVSQYADDIELKKSLPREAKVKSAWFSANKQSTFDYWSNRTPMIFASTSTKYEWGKVRALYGCDVTSFIMTDFAMGDAEDTLPSYFPVGQKANEEYVKKMTDKMRRSVPFCFDYDDFNSQHSISSMQMVIQAWIDVFSLYLTPEQIKAADWTVESVATMMVRFNDIDQTHKINGTLMSGWRLTSFVNTVLNRVYLQSAGLIEHSVYSLHNGDDMYATTRNVKEAVKILANAKKIGIRAQASKMNIGTIGEFLRVDARSEKPTSAQYLTRAIATMVHGRVEVGKPNDLLAFVNATDTRFEAAVKRGAKEEVLQPVLSHIDKFCSELFNTELGVLDMYRKLHPLQGGKDEQALIQDVRIMQKRTHKDKDALLGKYSMCQGGMVDYLTHIVDTYGLKNIQIQKKEYLVRAMDSLERSMVGYELVVENRPMIYNYRGLYKSWHKSGFVPAITKIRTAGIVAAKTLPGINSVPAAMIRNSKDPIELMKAIL